MTCPQANCPYCPCNCGANGHSWGMSHEGYASAKRKHDAGHKSEVCLAPILKDSEDARCPNPKPCKEHTPAARPGGWEQEFDRQLAITFKDQELHPAQYGQLIKWIREFRAQAIASARKEELEWVLKPVVECHDNPCKGHDLETMVKDRLDRLANTK